MGPVASVPPLGDSGGAEHFDSSTPCCHISRLPLRLRAAFWAARSKLNCYFLSSCRAPHRMCPHTDGLEKKHTGHWRNVKYISQSIKSEGGGYVF